MRRIINEAFTTHVLLMSLLALMKWFGVIEIKSDLVILIPFLAVVMTIIMIVIVTIIGSSIGESEE